MSEQLTEQSKAKDVYISEEDVSAIDRFFTHFNFALSQEFSDARAAFIADKTVDTQKQYRFQLAKEIGRIKGQNALVDDLFQNIMETSDKINYNMQFDKDLEELVGVDPTDQA